MLRSAQIPSKHPRFCCKRQTRTVSRARLFTANAETWRISGVLALDVFHELECTFIDR